MNFFKIITLLIFIAFYVISCRDYPIEPNNNESAPTIEETKLISSSDAILGINSFIIKQDSLAQLTQYDEEKHRIPSIWKGTIFNSGLWIAGEQKSIIRCNILGATNSLERSNYTNTFKSEKLGVYFVNKSIIENPANSFPSNFPLEENGKPKLYGDAMLFSVYRSDTTRTTPILQNPIRGLRFNQIVYAYKAQELSRSIFIQINIFSVSQGLSNAFIGFWIDADLSQEKVGYDSINGISYIYRNLQNGENTHTVFGYTLLHTPNSFNRQVGITSHRIMLKSSLELEYGQSFNNSQNIYSTLKGLSNSGKRMVNPTTDKNTYFAFTGNPITNSGWLDTERDARQLLSSGPFNLNSDQRLVVLMTYETGESLSEALVKLKLKVADIRNKPHLWQF